MQIYFCCKANLSSINTKAHENNPSTIIQNIRDWVNAFSRRASFPGHLTIIDDFTNGQTIFPVTMKIHIWK